MKTENWKFKINLRRPAALALIALLILSSIFALTYRNTPIASAAWYNASWNYRQKIIIDHNKVPNTDQTDFPVLVKITDVSNAIFTKAQSDGDDIRFTSSNETTDLSFEIERFSTSAGDEELIAWVKIPTLSHLTDTTIYLYYGNDSASSGQTPTAVWSNAYTAAWHMNDATTATVADSLGLYTGSKTAASEPVEATGKIGKAQSFDSNNDRINLPNLGVSGASSRTVSFWTQSPGNTKASFGSGTNSAQQAFTIETNRSGFIYFEGWAADAYTQNSFTNADWNYVSVSYSGGDIATGLKIYVNGSLQPLTFVNTGVTLNTLNSDYSLGYRRYTDSLYQAGQMDETHFSSTARSADWIATEYNSQNSPSTFATISGEVGKDNYTYQAAPAGWYDMAWGSRQPIVFDHTKVPNTNQTDFPALVKIIDVNNDIWAKAQADGDDILFADTSGNKLAHEIEKYDSATHELYAWVKVPSLLTAVNTTIYMYYGNSGSASQQSATAVWSNGYAGVWHLPNGTSLTASDSTSSGNNATSITATPTSGKVDGSALFDGINQKIALGSATYINYSQAFTVSFWSYLNNYDQSYPEPIVLKTNSAYPIEVAFSNQPNYLGITFGSNNTVQQKNGISSATYVGVWRSITLTYNGSGSTNSANYSLYDNGSASSTTSAGSYGQATQHSDMGVGSASYNLYNGKIDETRVSTNVSRSADWIATEYANQNDPASFESFQAAETADTFAPSNPSTITALYSAGGSPILLNAGSDSTPYYSWPEPEVAGGASDQTGAYVSGVAGYYSYFGTSCGGGGADPTLTRGALSDSGSGLHYSSDVNVSVPDLTTNQGVYCLRIKTKDNAGNISAVSEVATYTFDSTTPNAPTFIATNPAGYSSTNSFDFTWPVATDVAGAGSSGLAGYQYKRGGSSGDSWSATQVATTKTAIASYQSGENIFLVRSIDNAGNTSAEVQTTYYYSNDVPVKPTAVTATPDIADENAFAFSWTAPVHSRPIVDYGYSVNAAPTTGNLTWTGSASTSLAADAFATIQGLNTFYIVAKDDSGAYGVADANVGSATFTCTTVAPPIPTGVSITDSSNRTIDLWALTIKWSAGSGQGASFDHYSIERSTDNISFAEIATSASTAYIDTTGLNNTTTYYYNIKSVDNAGSPSAASSTVSKMPTGKYTTPPTIVTEPVVSPKASSATIAWTVNRNSTSAVRFGTTEADLSRVQINSLEETTHSINLAGLAPATTYYYQLQSLDNFRDYTSESAFSVIYNFTTLPAPSIKEMNISAITVASAEISFETSSATAITLNYGKTFAYGDTLENTSATTMHSAKLEKLESETTYHLRVNGVDIDGNILISDDYVFDTLPMPKISNLTVLPDYTGPNPGIKINWTTNVPTSSSVEYIPKQGTIAEEQSKSALVTDHEIILQQLADSTSYHFYVYGADQFGNTARSDQNSLDTPLDSRPPKITDLNIEAQSVGSDSGAKAQIIVSWKTDEPATSQVEYGQGVSGNTYGNKTQEDVALSLNHTVIIGNLDSSKTYHLKAVSKDKANNVSNSEDNAVITKKASESAFSLILQSLSRAFSWLNWFKR